MHYFQQQEKAIQDMARCGIAITATEEIIPENEGCNITFDQENNAADNPRKLVKSSSSYENIYDKADLENVHSDDKPSAAKLAETLGDPRTKTVLPSELCSSFENIYMGDNVSEAPKLDPELTLPETSHAE